MRHPATAYRCPRRKARLHERTAGSRIRSTCNRMRSRHSRSFVISARRLTRGRGLRAGSRAGWARSGFSPWRFLRGLERTQSLKDLRRLARSGSAANTRQDEVGCAGTDFENSPEVFRFDRPSTEPDQEDRLEPIVHEDMARLEDRADLHRKGLTASIAFVGADARARALQAADPFDLAAARTRWALRPHTSFDVSVCLFLTLKTQIAVQLHDQYRDARLPPVIGIFPQDLCAALK